MTDPRSSQAPQSSQGPTRTIADVARVFLSGARPTPPNGAPTRTPPLGVRAATQTAVRGMVVQPEIRPAAQADDSWEGLIVASSSMQHAGSLSQLYTAAGALAEENATTVCVLSIQNDTFSAALFGAESPEDVPAVQTGGSGAIDLAIARILHTLRPAVGMWMVAAPHADHPALRRLLPAASRWLFTSATDNESVIHTYQQMKTFLPTAPSSMQPSLFLLSNYAVEARAVHGRLRLALHKFQQRDLPLAGISGMTAPAAERFRTVELALKHQTGPMAPSDLVGPHGAVWAAVLDELLPSTGIDAEMENEELLNDLAESAAVAVAAGGGNGSTGSMVIQPMSSGELPTEQVESAFTKMQHNVSSLHHELGHTVTVGSEQARDARARRTLANEDVLSSVLDFDERAALTAELPTKTPPVVAPLPPSALTRIASAPAAAPVAVAQQPLKAALSQALPPVASILPPMTPVVPQPVAAPVHSPSPTIAAPVREVVTAPALPMTDKLTLRGFPLPGMDARNPIVQWSVVQRSFAELMPGVKWLEAAAPQTWATYAAFALDSQETLHVWALYQNSIAPFALREWASQHRTMLMLGHTDHPIDQDRPVMLHLVLPIDAPSNDPALRPFLTSPTPDVFLYRLRGVEFAGQLAMVVLPLA